MRYAHARELQDSSGGQTANRLQGEPFTVHQLTVRIVNYSISTANNKTVYNIHVFCSRTGSQDLTASPSALDQELLLECFERVPGSLISSTSARSSRFPSVGNALREGSTERPQQAAQGAPFLYLADHTHFGLPEPHPFYHTARRKTVFSGRYTAKSEWLSCTTFPTGCTFIQLHVDLYACAEVEIVSKAIDDGIRLVISGRGHG